MDSTDNDDSWLELISDIPPLKKAARDTSRPQKTITITPKLTASKIYSGQALSNLIIDDSSNIDANTLRRFRKGDFRIESELDLHGQTEEQAFEKVINFIKTSYLKGRRCISIITGKGLHIENQDPIFRSRAVLKERVPQWLNLPEVRPLILAINHPSQNEGGSGVIRILLRRQRKNS